MKKANINMESKERILGIDLIKYVACVMVVILHKIGSGGYK